MQEPIELQKYLQQNIPLTAAMKLRVIEITPAAVTITMPLSPNRNHQGTAFAGSISSLGLISGWATLWHIMHTVHGFSPVILAGKSETTFKLPINGDCEARVVELDAQTLTAFLEAFSKGEKARISVTTQIVNGGKIASLHRGEYIALPGK